MRTIPKGLLSSRRLSLGTAILVVLLMASTSLTLIPFNKGTTVHAATSNGSSFTFTATGDYDQTAATTANLNYIAHSGASFNLGLGDFNYNSAATAVQWSSYAKGLLPTNFPFEVIPGDQDGGRLLRHRRLPARHHQGRFRSIRTGSLLKDVWERGSASI